MELKQKHFSELTAGELYKILKARCEVFIVEQNCPYQDIDEFDPIAYHLWLEENGKLQAYVRVLPQNTMYENASIGRVISLKRRCGLATTLLNEGIAVAKAKFNAHRLTIGAQLYARKLYEGVGFVQCSDEYLEDGIVHIHMQLEIK